MKAPLDALLSIVFVSLMIGVAIGAILSGHLMPKLDERGAISTLSRCPACGHRGCTLRCIPAGQFEVGEKRAVETTPPMVERKCTTCGALAYEKTVLEPEKWVKK